MSNLQWHADFTVNVGQIDDQHRQMLDLALDLHRAVESELPLAHLLEKLDVLAAFTRRHFAFEETLMLEHDYPGLAAHREEHANLLQRLQQFRERLQNGWRLKLASAADIDGDWVLAHVVGADRKLGEFLNERGVA